MADNYLEKKMEEYRSGALSKPAARRLSPTGERPGTVSFRIDQLRVLVTDASDDVGRAVVRKLRGAGCRVAFVSPRLQERARNKGVEYYAGNHVSDKTVYKDLGIACGIVAVYLLGI